jgi:CBS domain-containing protein
LVEVAEIMGSKGISGVPVLDSSDKVVGVISERDFLARMGPDGPRNFMTVVAGCLRAKGCVALPIRARTAADIMTTPPVTIHDGMPLVEIAEIFAEKSINRVPVTDAEGRILGMITRNDIIAATLRSRTCSLNTSAK